MPLITAEDRPHVTCKRCGTVLVLAEGLNASGRREVARLRQADHTTEAIAYLTRSDPFLACPCVSMQGANEWK